MMRTQLSRWLFVASLAGGSLLAIADQASAQPIVKDHRMRPPLPAGPTQAPPPPQTENRGAKRRGFFYVEGHWDWRGNQYVWVKGRWEKNRADKKRVRPPRWELRGNAWVRVDGEVYDYAPKAPTQAPPPAKEERFLPRNGFVFVKGHWEWDDDEYVWVPGKLERARNGSRWRESKWENRNGQWIYTAGDWEAAPQYPTEAPPTPREEKQAARAGYVWINGRYDWQNGSYQWVAGHWERERATESWKDGRWERQGDRWVYVQGSWARFSEYPSAPPPAAPPEDMTKGQRPGHVFVPGAYKWIRGQYVWYPGGYQAARPGMHWEVGPGWQQRGDKWVFTGGTWQKDAPQVVRPFTWDNRGWVLLGEQTVSGKTDTDAFELNQKSGKIGKLMVVVTDSDIDLDSMSITFTSGSHYDPAVRQTFKENTRTRAIDLPNQEIPRRVTFKYHNLPGGGRARVQLWGFVGAGAQPQPPTMTPPPIAPPPPPPVAPVAPAAPQVAPPPPQVENIAPKDGYVWARGHYEWKNGAYQWMPGHWERQRARMNWSDARWELRGNVYVFVPGGWR